jgi:hypothetical protein
MNSIGEYVTYNSRLVPIPTEAQIEKIAKNAGISLETHFSNILINARYPPLLQFLTNEKKTNVYTINLDTLSPTHESEVTIPIPYEISAELAEKRFSQLPTEPKLQGCIAAGHAFYQKELVKVREMTEKGKFLVHVVKERENPIDPHALKVVFEYNLDNSLTLGYIPWHLVSRFDTGYYEAITVDGKNNLFVQILSLYTEG